MKRNVLFKDFAAEWLADHAAYIKKSTYGTYTALMYNHLIPFLGDLPISSINQKVINDFTIYMLMNGRKDKKGGLSQKSIKDVLTLLKLCLRDAQEKGFIKILSYKNHIIKRTSQSERHILTKSEQMQLSEYILNHPTSRNLGILFMLQTGIRIGELCALQWKDIDINHQIISITKTLQRIFVKNADGENSTQVIITPPKSAHSCRIIPISNCLMEVLSNISMQEPEIYFLTGTLKYTEPRTYLNYYKKILKCADISYINLHGLRHTFATRCIESGGDSKTVSELLGHSSVQLTMNLYVHPQIEQKRKCIEMANDL